ncbi:MAG: MaoC family dehydratase [Candidatus Binataceae bacterium]
MNLDASALTGRDNYFEDFNIGEVYQHARGKTMEALENVLITNLVLNTAQAHFNEDLAASLPQQHRIVFGGVTASLVIGLAMQDTGENALREIGLDKVRFRVPVLHGDTLYAFTQVLDKQDGGAAASGLEAGEVRFKHWGVNQRGETVFEGERRVLIKKRSFSTAGLEVDRAEETHEAPARPAIRRSSAPKPKARAVKAPPRRSAKKVAPASAKGMKNAGGKTKAAKPKPRRH